MSVKKKIAAAVLAAVCLIACIAVSYAAGYSRGFNSHKTTLKAGDDTSEETIDPEDLSEDDIKPLEEDTISVLCCGVDNTQKLTDAIMYALFNTKTGEVDILRIPRDTFVGSEFPTGKVNAIYGHPYEGMSGIETLKSYLEENWKLNIDYYATIDLASVRDIVDDMGGVTMNIEEQINYLPGKVLYPGEQTLNGEQAEWIIRYRAGYANGDLGRIDAQTQFIFACIDRVHELGRMKSLPILMGHYDDIDTDMPLNKMISVASALFEVDTDDIEMHVVPGNGTMYYSYSVYAVDEQALVDVMNEHFMTQGNSVTAEDLNIPNIYGGSSSSSSSSSSGNWNSNTQGSQSQWTQDSTQQGSQSQNDQQTQSSEEGDFTPQYQYDKNGNPLYRLDENGDPIYDYDEDGNVVYIYQQVQEEEKKEEESSKPSGNVTTNENGQTVILSKSNQEKAQQETEEESQNESSDKEEKSSSSSKTSSSSSSSKTSSSSSSSSDTGFSFSNRG